MQKKSLNWTNPATNDADMPFAESSGAGYMVSIDGATPVSLPGLVYGTSFDMCQLIKTLKPGKHTICIAAVSTDDVVGDYSAPAEFTVCPRPRAPANVSVT